MPGSMTHLLVANKMSSIRDPLFLLGNIAPDAIDMREGTTRTEKDILHFRNNSRWSQLEALAKKVDPQDTFLNGYLLHLYTDALWDAGPIQEYALNCKENDWFLSYRHELSLAGSWTFHHSVWNQDVWDSILSIESIDCTLAECPSSSEILSYRERVYQWHRRNPLGPSSIFTPDMIETFACEIVKSYPVWLGNVRC